MQGGIVLRVVNVMRPEGQKSTATLTTKTTDYEGTLLEPRQPACGKSHPLKDGDSLVLRLDQRPSGDLFFQNVSCACNYLLYDVRSWPTGRGR
jgi:hypothetical protein